MKPRIITARTFQEFACVLHMRQHVFLTQEGKFEHNLERLIDHYDDGPETYNLLARDINGSAVATMRLNIGPLEALPFSEHYTAPAGVLPADAVISSTSLLAITKQARGRRTLIDLILYSMHIWEMHQVTHVVSTVNASNAAMWSRIGFHRFGDDVYLPHINDHIAPLWIGLNSLKTWLYR